MRWHRMALQVDLLLEQMSRGGLRPGRYSGLPEHCILPYVDYNPKICFCWLRMYPRGDRVVVIATDHTLRLSTGASITNAIELVASEICEQHGIRPRDLILIEHYDWRGTEAAAGLGDDAEHFDLVELRWRRRTKEFIDPQWLRLSRSNVEVLIGCPLRVSARRLLHGSGEAVTKEPAAVPEESFPRSGYTNDKDTASESGTLSRLMPRND